LRHDGGARVRWGPVASVTTPFPRRGMRRAVCERHCEVPPLLEAVALLPQGWRDTARAMSEENLGGKAGTRW
jgi:hypothetical protein